MSEADFRHETPEGDYAAFLDEVEAIQREQVKIIRSLGVCSVFYEGLTDGYRPAYDERAKTVTRLRRPNENGHLERLVDYARRRSLVSTPQSATLSHRRKQISLRSILGRIQLAFPHIRPHEVAVNSPRTAPLGRREKIGNRDDGVTSRSRVSTPGHFG